MILSNKAIFQLCNSGTAPLIEQFNEENLRASSYDLTVGTEYYVGQERTSLTLLAESLKTGQSFSIPPHAVCFILAAETINLPSNITAKVSLRMSHIYAGLVLTAQPPFDPGYSGKAIVMLHNLSSDAVYMRSGERIATIEFMQVAQSHISENEEPLPSKSKAKQTSVASLEMQLSKPVVSSLSEIARLSNATRRKVNWMIGQMFTLVALIVAVLAVPGLLSFNSLQEKTKEQEERLKDLTSKFEAYKLQMNGNEPSANANKKPAKGEASE